MSPAKIAAGMVRSEASGKTSLEMVGWLVLLVVGPLTVWLGSVGIDLQEETVAEILTALLGALVAGVLSLVKYRERRRQDRVELSSKIRPFGGAVPP